MQSEPLESSAIRRGQWLAELGEALAVARELAARLDLSNNETAELTALEAKLVGLIDEVDALRRGGWQTDEPFDPFPTNYARK